eukprot:10760699-Ditylum_brightwellii.AAC.1
MALSVEPATDIGIVEEGGSKAAPTTEELTPSAEPATNIGNVEEGGSKQCQLQRIWHPHGSQPPICEELGVEG